jgi:hypothetical protein
MHRPLIALAILALAGCQPAGDTDALKHELEDARNQLRQCNDDKQSLQSVIVKQQKQVDTLLDLGDKRLDKIFHVKSIELGQYTGGVNLSGADDNHDAIKVYLRPLDQDGSVIKAAGAVKIQFFDLAIAGNNLIGEYNWGVDEIGKQWSNNFVTYFYSFVCPWKAPPTHPEITVRVEFTDYLTGQVSSAQKAVTVKLPPPGARPATMPIVPHPDATQPASRPAPTKEQLRELYKPQPPARPAPDAVGRALPDATAKPAPDVTSRPPPPAPSTQPTPLTNLTPEPTPQPEPVPQPAPSPRPQPAAQPAPTAKPAPAPTTNPAPAPTPAPAPAAKPADIGGPPTRPAGQ